MTISPYGCLGRSKAQIYVVACLVVAPLYAFAQMAGLSLVDVSPPIDDRGVQLSSLTEVGNGVYHSISENCQELYRIEKEGEVFTFIDTISIAREFARLLSGTSSGINPDSIDIEALAYWNGYLLMADERHAALFAYDLNTSPLMSYIDVNAAPRVLNDLKTWVRDRGMEGMTVNGDHNLLYLLREKDDRGYSEIMVFGLKKRGSGIELDYLDRNRINNGDDQARLTGLSHSSEDSILYAIRSTHMIYGTVDSSSYRVVRFELDEAGRLRTNSYTTVSDISDSLKAAAGPVISGGINLKYTTSTNIEGLHTPNGRDFLLISDNHRGPNCDIAANDGQTGIFRFQVAEGQGDEVTEESPAEMNEPPPTAFTIVPNKPRGNYCQGSRVLLRARGDNAFMTREHVVVWSINDSITPNRGRELELPRMKPGLTTVKATLVYVAASSRIVKKEHEFRILVKSKPALTSPPKATVSGTSIVLTATANSPTVRYRWISPRKDTLEGQVAVIRDARIAQLGRYTLQVRDTVTGCQTMATLRVANVPAPPEATTKFVPFTINAGETNLRQIVQPLELTPSTREGLPRAGAAVEAGPYTYWSILGERGDDYVLVNSPNSNVARDSLQSYVQKAKNKYNDYQGRLNALIASAESRDPAVLLDTIDYLTVRMQERISSINTAIAHANTKPYFQYYEDVVTGDVKYFKVPKQILDKELNAVPFWYVDINISGKNGSYIFPSVEITGWGALTFGAVVLPFKVRPNYDAFTFSTDFGVSVFLGRKYRVNHYRPHFISFGGGIGLSTIRINQKNTNAKLADNPLDVSAVTITYGTIWELGRVQAALLVGHDWINNSNNVGPAQGYNWIYQGKPWIGVGLGYSIFPAGEGGNKKDSKSGT